MATESRSGKIMVVDDHPLNLRLLEEMLGQQGYWVQSFPRGRMAVAAALQTPPDLVLLDINMPEMNGYEVCARFKGDVSLADIPIIFLSALSETQDKVKGFEAGGVDYITKPFQFYEVQARVETHLRLVQLQRALREHNRDLEETVAARTRELAGVHRRLKILDKAKSDFLKLICHEFRTPLTGLLGVGDLLLSEFGTRPEDAELRDMFEQSRGRILSILDDAELLTQIEVESKGTSQERLPLTEILRAATEASGDFARSRKVFFLQPPECGYVTAEKELLKRALNALLETAVKFSTADKPVRFSVHNSTDTTFLTIVAAGRAVPVSAIQRFFDVFGIREPITPGGDLGLGPPLAYRILSLFGGSVEVANTDSSEPGMQLTVSLKRAA